MPSLSALRWIGNLDEQQGRRHMSSEFVRCSREIETIDPHVHERLTDFLTGKGRLEQSDWAWDDLFAFVKTAQTPGMS
jgi:hypothetical protein